MGDSLWTFGFEAANFLALTALLAWLFFKPVRKAIHDQQQAIEDQVEQAAKQLADADKRRAELEQRERTFSQELDEMRARAREAAQQEANRILADGRQQLSAERDDLHREVLSMTQAQATRLTQLATDVAQRMVQRLLRQLNGPDLEAMLFGAALRELQQQPDHGASLQSVESASRLAPQQRAAIHDQFASIQDNSDAQYDVQFVEKPDLLGGVRFQTAHGLIDASIAGLSNYCQQELESRISESLGEATEHE